MTSATSIKRTSTPLTSAKPARITAIDTLRGFALCGILVMNIMSFAMPDEAYYNPTIYGGDDLLNRLVYGFAHLFFDQKFMAIFSMLFGASVMLILSKARDKGTSGARIHYTRNFWLLVIGVLHGIFLWEGDILRIYAVCSFILFFFRNVKPRVQLVLGIIIFLLPSGANLFIANELPNLDAAGQQILVDNFAPSETVLAKDIALFQNRTSLQPSYDLAASRGNEAQNLIDLALLVDILARALGMMLIGMSFYSLGILTAQRSQTFYRRMVFLGFGVGFPIVGFGLYQYILRDWEASYSLFVGRIPNHIATIFIASGYIALIMLWSKHDVWHRAQNSLAAVGRMALSNYIGQTLLATFVFYGYGLGLYGQFNRIAQLGVVIVIWTIQILVSPWWLKRFRYGPLEWLWRSLTYLRIESMRKRSAARVS